MIYYSTNNSLIKDFDRQFNPKKNMLCMPLTESFTTIESEYAHPLCATTDYALHLLYLDKEKNKKKVEKIITEISKYQNIDKGSHIFGYWQKYAEEKINDGKLPYAGVNGRVGCSLLQILKNFASVLSPEVCEILKTCCINTIFSFFSQYNEQSPIVILQFVYMSVIGGEMFNIPQFVKYGEQILTMLYNRIIYHNSFLEYNDLAHSIKETRLLTLISESTQNKICNNCCNQLLDMIWKCFAVHFHRPTMQIAGPFSLTDSDYLQEDFYNFLYYSCNSKIYFPHTSPEVPEIAKCPIKYYPYFSGEKRNEFLQNVVSYGMSYPFYRFSMVSTTYMREKFTVGTFNREVFWSPRRPFMGYFGNEKKLYSFKLEVLHDFFPYASAALHSVQHQGHVLGHISFLTNRGDKHIDIDSNGSVLSAKDLRIRFSISGEIEDLEISHTKTALRISYEDINLYYNIPFAQFDGLCVKYKIYEEDENLYFDAILHSSELSDINFAAMQKAIMEFVFLITDSKELPAEEKSTITEQNLESEITLKNHVLKLVTPLTPGSEAISLNYDKQYINSTPLEEYTIQINEKTKNFNFIDKLSHSQSVKLPVYDSSKKTPELIEMIENLSTIKFDEMEKLFMEILSALSDSLYALSLQKEMAILIVVNSFECAKNDDYRFDDLIGKKYFDIFYKISASESFETIKENLVNLCSDMKHDKSILDNRYKNKVLISSIMKLIDDNLLNPDLSLNFIANKLGYSESHLSRIFFEATRMNYISYIQRQKLNYAINLLKSTKITIKEVSEKIGYSNPNSFMRMFHKLTGMTVIQYLKSDN